MAFSLSSFLSLSAFPFSSPLHQSRLGTIGVSACVPLQRCSRSLVFSALISYFSYSQASDVRTHSPPSIGRRERRVVQRLVATSAVLCFVLFCFGIGSLFLSHRFLLTGLIPARGMVWLWVPLDGIFFAFAPLGLFGVCVISESVCVGSV